MSLSVKYSNLFGNPISAQQVKMATDYYRKEFFEDAELKKIEFYNKDNIVFKLNVYLSATDNLESIATDVLASVEKANFYHNKQTIGNFTIWDIDSRSHTKASKAKIVYDNQGREIAYQTYIGVTNEIEKTTKNFYLENWGDFDRMAPIYNNGVFEFDYNFPNLDQGEIHVEVHLGPFEDDGGFIIRSGENILLHHMITPVFSWENHPYYHSASPLVPVGPV